MNREKNRNIILIGMPGSGKSTLGVLLAKALGRRFVDTDLLIQEREGRLLQDIIDNDGIEKFLQIEEQSCCPWTWNTPSSPPAAAWSIPRRGWRR
ncbi:MAG: shikimate kinase [Oscillospiraceae bacterium]